MKYFIIGMLALAFAVSCAQDEEPFSLDGASFPFKPDSKKPRVLLGKQLKAKLVVLPPTQPPEGNLSEPTGYVTHPVLTVGYVAQAPAGLLAEASWQKVSGYSPDGIAVLSGWATRLELHSPGAVGLRVQFQGFHPEVLVSIYDPNSDVVLEATGYPDEKKLWWAPTLWGNTIGIEVFVPEHIDAQKVPEIVSIGYMYSGIEPDFSIAELGCHLNVSCYPDYNSARGAVARIQYVVGSQVRVCTGQLINRIGGDFAPIFFTAQHCISTQASAQSAEFYWFYEASTCFGSPPNLNTVPRNQGALLLKQETSTDWSLLGLFERPHGNFYLGWNTGDWPRGSPGRAIHHPGGTHKRITFFVVDGTGYGCFRSNLWMSQIYIDYNLGNGTIEGGSSGSAAIDPNLQVRGVCSCAETGGNDSNGNPIWLCPTETNPIWVGWGMISQAMPVLRPYLQVIPNPTYSQWSWVGDYRNEGTREQGTEANPFDTVHEATFCVPRNGRVIIWPGTYNERFKLWRPMRLERHSAVGGIVRIGAP